MILDQGVREIDINTRFHIVKENTQNGVQYVIKLQKRFLLFFWKDVEKVNTNIFIINSTFKERLSLCLMRNLVTHSFPKQSFNLEVELDRLVDEYHKVENEKRIKDTQFKTIKRW